MRARAAQGGRARCRLAGQPGRIAGGIAGRAHSSALALARHSAAIAAAAHAQTLVPTLHLPLQQVPQLVTLAPAREHREVQPGRRQPGWQAVQRLAARQAAQLAPHAAHDAPELVDRQYWPAGQGAAQVQLLQLGPARCGAHVRHVLPSRHVAHLAGQALHVAALPVTRHHWPAPHEGKQ